MLSATNFPPSAFPQIWEYRMLALSSLVPQSSIPDTPHSIQSRIRCGNARDAREEGGFPLARQSSPRPDTLLDRGSETLLKKNPSVSPFSCQARSPLKLIRTFV